MNISVNNLSLNIGEKSVLQNVCFNLKSAEILKIIGSNGSGKTTLLHCLLGIYNDYTGVIKIEDEIIEPRKQHNFNKSISFLVNQNMYYPQLTVCENIDIFKYYYSINKIEINLNNLIQNFELNSFLHITASSLSEGFKKKLSLILSLLNDGEIVILDEPFNFLDENSIEIFTKFLLNCIDRKKIIIFSAHQNQTFNKIKHQTLNL